MKIKCFCIKNRYNAAHLQIVCMDLPTVMLFIRYYFIKFYFNKTLGALFALLTKEFN